LANETTATAVERRGRAAAAKASAAPSDPYAPITWYSFSLVASFSALL
jgi:hypothetical protein